jgi:hypothetical protein
VPAECPPNDGVWMGRRLRGRREARWAEGGGGVGWGWWRAGKGLAHIY